MPTFSYQLAPAFLAPFGMVMEDRSYATGGGYRFGFNGQEKVDEVSGVGNHNTALFGELETRIGRRWNLDPKPVIGISQYCVFGNNPIWFSDGLLDTVIIGVNPTGNKGKDKIIVDAALKQVDEKNAIHIFAHGGPNKLQIYNPVTKMTTDISSAKEFEDYMNAQNIPEWEKAQKGGNITIILHSCRTAAEQSDPETNVKTDNSIAKQISESHPNISVIAPTERDYFTRSGEVGPYTMTNTDVNGNRLHKDRLSRWVFGEYTYKKTSIEGEWKTYRNGKVTKRHGATWKPTRRGSGR